MATNLSSLIPSTTSATALSNLILVTPNQTVGYQPQNLPSKDGQQTQQPPAILFHYEGENNVTLQSDITDHYVEDNTAVQDQIALRPERVTTNGFIGELNDVAPKELVPLKIVADKLTVVSAYVPVISTTAKIAYNRAAYLYAVTKNAIDASVSAWSSVSGGGGQSVIDGNGISLQPNQNKQQLIFQQFYGYWRNRTLFTVQTPWAVFKNMAIESLRAIQDSETRMITDFDITFKLMRFASTITTDVDVANFQGRSASQAAGITDLGTSTPKLSDSLSSALSSNFPGSLGA